MIVFIFKRFSESLRRKLNWKPNCDLREKERIVEQRSGEEKASVKY